MQKNISKKKKNTGRKLRSASPVLRSCIALARRARAHPTSMVLLHPGLVRCNPVGGSTIAAIPQLKLRPVPRDGRLWMVGKEGGIQIGYDTFISKHFIGFAEYIYFWTPYRNISIQFTFLRIQVIILSVLNIAFSWSSRTELSSLFAIVMKSPPLSLRKSFPHQVL